MTPAQLRAGDKEALEAFVAEHGLDVPFDGMTPLSMAAFDGKIRLIKWMLKRGASVDYAGAHGRTPLMWAVSDGRLRAVEVLLEAGADPELADDDGLRPLHLTVKCPKSAAPRIAKLLIARGVDRFARNAAGQTALAFAEAGGPGTYVDRELLAALRS